MKNVNPLWIDIPEDLLKELMEEGVEKMLGYKLCKAVADYDVDEGTPSFKIRVCGGPTKIACMCDIQKQNDLVKVEAPILNHELYRDDDY